MKTLAIMQPTLMPWLGYFALMDSVDTFIYLDDVQFAKQSWQSRNRVKTSQGELMLSLRVNRTTIKGDIKDVKLADTHNHKKLMKTLEGNLGKAPYFSLCESIVENAYIESEDFLARFNTGIIDRVASACGIQTQRVLASSLGVETQEKTERLLAFCKHLNAENYLSPVGSFNYLAQKNPFANSGVNLSFQSYEHPEYVQGSGAFLPYMGCLDALSWVGPDKLLEVVQSGNDAPLTIEQLGLANAA